MKRGEVYLQQSELLLASERLPKPETPLHFKLKSALGNLDDSLSAAIEISEQEAEHIMDALDPPGTDRTMDSLRKKLVIFFRQLQAD